MKKLTTDFIILQYQSGIENYSAFTTEVGLWESEQYVFTKYLKKVDQILDIGCGTGRTTFHLFRLGYQQIKGIDLTPGMIARARELTMDDQYPILFEIGDARNIDSEDHYYDAAIFSFNGLMSIPGAAQREKALNEIYRVLKDEGFFIFTTHDREKDKKYLKFWEEQKEVWKEGRQDSRLYEFGDLITTSKNEESPIYIHIPNRSEVEILLQKVGFELIETFYRSDQFEEREKVKEKSGECRFWVVRKSKKSDKEKA